MSLLGLFSIFSTCAQLIKEATTPVIPAENWANKELYYADMMKGVSSKQLQRNLANGKYRFAATYPEPHRDANGKIIIENCQLYKEDSMNCDPLQVHKWIETGKYNLNAEELRIERLRIKKEFDYLYSLVGSSGGNSYQKDPNEKEASYDYKNASGVIAWREADNAVKAYEQGIKDIQF